MKLALRRVLLLSILVLTTGAISIYAFNHDDGENVVEFMNTRDQSDDYDRLFDNYNFKTITVQFEESVFEEMIMNMQAHFDLYGDYVDNTMYPVDITYIDESENFTIKEVGFRTRSTTSRNLPRTTDWRERYVYHQTSFQLQFNETFEYENHTNKYEVLKTREVFNLEQLNFEYSQNYRGDYDQAMISEAFTHYLYKEAGLKVANASYGLVYLKIGETLVSYGFYTFIESIDSEFLKDNFDSDQALEYGDLFKITDVMTEGTLRLDYLGYTGINTDDVRYTYSLRNNTNDGTRKTFDSFTYFIQRINDQEYFLEHYDELIDVDLFVRYLAISFLAGNTDDLRYNFNNYYLYFDVYTNKATFIPFDLDNSLGFGKHLDGSGDFGTDYSIYYNIEDPSPLIENIFLIEEVRDLYEEYLAYYLDNIFIYSVFSDMYLEAKDMYENILISEGHLGNKTFDTRNMEWYFTEKTTNVLAQLQ